MITLPDEAFVSPANPYDKRSVPSLAFLIEHPGSNVCSEPFALSILLALPSSWIRLSFFGGKSADRLLDIQCRSSQQKHSACYV